MLSSEPNRQTHDLHRPGTDSSVTFNGMYVPLRAIGHGRPGTVPEDGGHILRAAVQVGSVLAQAPRPDAVDEHTTEKYFLPHP